MNGNTMVTSSLPLTLSLMMTDDDQIVGGDDEYNSSDENEMEKYRTHEKT